MTRTKLPSQTEDAWEGGLMTNPPRPVSAVSCAGGRVVAAGRELYLIRAGTDALLERKLPEGVSGKVLAVAAEPRPPFRIALASEEGGVILLEQTPQGDSLTRILRDPPRTDARATHLAWDRRVLFARWDDGAISRIQRERDDYIASTATDLGFVDALAADGRGSVVVLSVEPPRVFRFKDDDVCVGADLDIELPYDRPLWLAVAGDTVALSVKGYGTYRSDGDTYTLCEAHPGGGPIAFQGTASRAALFGALVEGDTSVVVRMEAEGKAQRICEMVAVGAPPAELVALAWDETRTTLWGASPAAGLIRHTPRAARKARRPVS